VLLLVLIGAAAGALVSWGRRQQREAARQEALARHWGQVCREPREIYTGPTVEAAEAHFAESADTWRERDPAMAATWERAWDDVVRFLGFPVELRTIVSTTNAIESLNARFPNSVRYSGHFPTEQAALKVLYVVAPKAGSTALDIARGRPHGVVRRGGPPPIGALACSPVYDDQH
jgi:transposase-like protein